MADNEHEVNVEIEAQGSAIEEVPPGTPMERFFFHQRRALEETAKALEALLPPGFKEHATEASREFARGFRVLVDATIDELKKISEKDEEPAPEIKADVVVETENSSEEIIAEVTEVKPEEQPRKSSTGKTKVKVKVD